MLPAVFPIIKAASAVTALIGTNPTRCYRHGFAPQGVEAPYLTWYVVSGVPENELSDLPRVDNYTVQIDCWSDNTGTGAAQVEALATAVRDAIEPVAHMTGVAVNGIDFETQRFRLGLTFTFWTPRPEASS